MSELTQVIGGLATITGEMRHIRSDMAGLQKEIKTLREEARTEILQLRGALTVHDADKNEILARALKELAEEKKRPNDCPPKYSSLLLPARH